MDREDISYISLFAVFVTIFLIYATRFNDKLKNELEREKRETEQLLVNSDKLATVGQLAAGVAHEIRNPLSVISGYIQLLKEDHKELQHVDIIDKELTRMNLIISEFLDISKPNSMQLETKDLNLIVQQVVTLLNAEAHFKNVAIEIKQPNNAIDIECEENQIKQVLINLVKNGIEAMPNGGVVTIELLEEENEAKIRIFDEGTGIPEEQLATLGKPFYTTKESGTGLGLMVSLKIIENHRGKMLFSSVVGKGTIVEVILPQKNVSEGKA
ncbi:two-component sensor histidine kinase [Anaerobacillus alkaliphilus]|uniref:histidine kinase n=2 Tax=Anaerobacillus alkaliphilus TaxID=1548597 RepID=A0A4V1LGR6_9BACI|nr:two-component sensor histidine kinase [Anaerobacillus alkaliphilus]